jgi:SAM-dependent methyltransferase
MLLYRLKKMAQFARGRILDIGFAQQPNPYLEGDVYGFDQCVVPLPANYKGMLTGDASKLKLEDRYDTILAGEIIEHLDDPIQFLGDCYRALTGGGRLVLSTPNPYHPAFALSECLMLRRYFYCPDHVHIFLPRFLVRLMERQGFRQVKTYSGGMELFKLTIPFPRAICYAVIFVGTKV